MERSKKFAASIISMIGTLVTTNAEMSSYLDIVNGATDVTSSNGWFVYNGVTEDG